MSGSATRYGKAEFLPRDEREGTALCLSGGGYRAALFHLGALRRLNELGVLAQVDTFTSVSGGQHHRRPACDAPDPRSGRVARRRRRRLGLGGGRRPADAGLRSAQHPHRAGASRLPSAATGFDQNAQTDALAAATRRGLHRDGWTTCLSRPRFVFCARDMRFREQWVFDSGRQDRFRVRRHVLAHGRVDARAGRGRVFMRPRRRFGDASPRRRRPAARRDLRRPEP